MKSILVALFVCSALAYAVPVKQVIKTDVKLEDGVAVPVAGVRKNFFQFVIHHVDADLFLELYVEWNIISVVGHELLGAGFDQIFDDLDKTNDEEIIAAAVEILLELVAEIDEAADTFDHLVQHAVDKLLELLQ